MPMESTHEKPPFALHGISVRDQYQQRQKDATPRFEQAFPLVISLLYLGRCGSPLGLVELTALGDALEDVLAVLVELDLGDDDL